MGWSQNPDSVKPNTKCDGLHRAAGSNSALLVHSGYLSPYGSFLILSQSPRLCLFNLQVQNPLLLHSFCWCCQLSWAAENAAVFTSKLSSDQNPTFATEVTVLIQNPRGKKKPHHPALSSGTAGFAAPAEKTATFQKSTHMLCAQVSRSDSESMKIVAELRFSLRHFSDKDSFPFLMQQ